jgi:hypothetical protein
MNLDDIIRMAVEADPGFDGGQNAMELLSNSIVGIAAIERFAALVAAHEREKVAQWMVERSYATGHGDTVEDLLKEIDWQVAEREQQKWVGLTEEEVLEEEEFINHRYGKNINHTTAILLDFVRQIEAKLKEKNGG